MNKQCQCSDSGCPVHRSNSACARRAVHTLYRIDMHDIRGARFCEDCGTDAMEAGVFSEESSTWRY